MLGRWKDITWTSIHWLSMGLSNAFCLMKYFLYLDLNFTKFYSWNSNEQIVIIGSGNGLLPLCSDLKSISHLLLSDREVGVKNAYEVLTSVGNSHRSAGPRPTTLEEDRKLFVNFSSILCLWFEIQGMRTYNFFDWVSNTGLNSRSS